MGSGLIKIDCRIENFISYGGYSGYRMEITTIQLSKETKEQIASFGNKNDTFDVILKRIYGLAVKEQFRNFMMSAPGFIPIDEAIKEAEEKWP